MSPVAEKQDDTSTASSVYRFRTEPLYGVWGHRGRLTLTFTRPDSGLYLTATREPDGKVSIYVPPFSPGVGAKAGWNHLERFLEVVSVYGHIAAINPADLGLTIRNVGITTRGYTQWGLLEEGFAPGWIVRGATWFAPDADPTAPYTPYLELVVSGGDADNPLPKVEWVSRQVGVDTEFRSNNTLLTAAWDDVEGVRNHVKMMIEEPDNEPFKSYRALVDSVGLRKFADAQDMWAAYREKWEWAKPRSRRVPTRAFDMVDELADQWGALDVSVSQRKAYGFGGTKRRQGDTNTSPMARRNVAVSAGVHNWYGSARSDLGEEGRTFHEKLARRFHQEKLGIFIVTAWDHYLLTRDPAFVRDNFRLMRCHSTTRDWNTPLDEARVFDVTAGEWVSIA